MIVEFTSAQLIRIISVWFAISIISQVLLIIWNKKHEKSYQFTTNCLLWTLPPIVLLLFNQTRFPTVWIVFSLLSVTTCYIEISRPAEAETMATTIAWFFFVHRCSMKFVYLSLIIGFCVFFDIDLLFNSTSLQWSRCCSTLMSYGFYFGVINRDLGKLVFDFVDCNIAAALPIQTPKTNRCSICRISFPVDQQKRPLDGILAVHLDGHDCRQLFHDDCLCSWVVVGKKQKCPTCQMIIDCDATFFTRSWEISHGLFLDWVSYCILWFPMISYIVGIIYIYTFIAVDQ